MSFTRLTTAIAAFTLLLTTVSAATTDANPPRVLGAPALQRASPGSRASRVRGARRRNTNTCSTNNPDSLDGTTGNYVCDGGDAVAGGEYNDIGNNGSASDSFIGAGDSNAIAGNNSGIGAGTSNSVPGSQSFAVAGDGNMLTGDRAIVGAGEFNTLDEGDAMIGAGIHNEVLAEASFVGAGGDGYNVAQNYSPPSPNNVADGLDAFIGAGDLNEITGSGSFIGAGGYAYATASNAPTAVGNSISGTDSFIGAGDQNTVSGSEAALAGGSQNHVDATEAFIGGGFANTIGSSAVFSVVSGGNANIANNTYEAIGGGYDNVAKGPDAMIPGGQRNEAFGTLSFAAGYQAHALNTGSFVWSDYKSGSSPLADTAADQFVVRASGGTYVYSSENDTTGVKLAAGSGAWSNLSDRNAKTDVVPLDDASILAKVAALPVSAWRYKTEAGVRHVGPMAQDFYAAFRVGEDDRHITTIDEDGVALAAIKALNRANGTLQSRVAKLETENIALLRRLDALATASKRPSHP